MRAARAVLLIGLAACIGQACARASPDAANEATGAATTSASASAPSTVAVGGAPLFFSLQAGGAIIAIDPATGDGNLTLAGTAGRATWWTERPARAAGSLRTADLAGDARLVGAEAGWLDRPNAALYGGAALGEGQGAVMVTVILTITAAPTFTPSTRRLTMPVSLVGVAPRNPWGEPVGDDDGGSEGGEGGESGGGSGGGGVGGGEGNGVSGVSSSIGASRGPRGWREVAAAQAAAAAAARAQASGGADAPSTQAAADADATSPIILTLAGASLTIDQWLLPTAYSQGADGWCVSAMDPNCNPYVYYGGGGGGTYYMYDAPM